MAIRYVCRYCNYPLGTIDQTTAEDERLGFHTLSEEERRQILHIQENGEVQANVICEHCQEAIQRYPELLLNNTIFH